MKMLYRKKHTLLIYRWFWNIIEDNILDDFFLYIYIYIYIYIYVCICNYCYMLLVSCDFILLIIEKFKNIIVKFMLLTDLDWCKFIIFDMNIKKNYWYYIEFYLFIRYRNIRSLFIYCLLFDQHLKYITILSIHWNNFQKMSWKFER